MRKITGKSIGEHIDGVALARLIFLAVIVYAAYAGFGRLQAMEMPNPIRLSGSLASICIAGASLFELRRRNLVLYAQLELAFALVSAWLFLQKASVDALSRTTTIVGLVYLIVRALDNWEKGRASNLSGPSQTQSPS